MRLRKRQKIIAPEGATSVSAIAGASSALYGKLPIGVHLESYQILRTELVVQAPGGLGTRLFEITVLTPCSSEWPRIAGRFLVWLVQMR